jgi:hypothetical protein
MAPRADAVGEPRSEMTGAREAGRAEPQPPIVGFGTGGSGTRVVAQILHSAGVYIGPELNPASDAKVMMPFLRRVDRSGWIEQVLAGNASRLAPPDPDALAGLLGSVKLQRQGIAAEDGRWGWKAPRTIYMLPLVHHAFPDVRTVQLVRDGRDMAYSRNQNQLRVYGDVIVGDIPDAPDPVRSIMLWSRVNLAAIRYAEARMPGQHLVLRYEDLCDDPATGAARLLGHIGIEPSRELLDKAAEQIAPSSSRGRWRRENPDEVLAVSEAGEDGLREFGYLDDGPATPDP